MTSDLRRVLLTAYPPDMGVARHVIDLAEGALAAGWKVDLASPAGSEQAEALAGRPGVRLHGLPGEHGPPSPTDAVAIPPLVRLVGDATVVHAHSSKAGFLTRLAAASAGRRRRTVFSPHAWSFWSADGPRAQLYLALERLAAHWCRTIVAVSAAERDAGVRAGVGRAADYRVVLNGVDVDRFSAPPSPVRGRVLFLGRLAPQKRPDVALRAFARLRELVPDATLDFVGDGSLRPELDRLAASLGVGDAVRFLGTRGDVPALLAGASCFVLTSDYEGCPLTVLEAMAAGVPVVATAVGGVPELVSERTGVLVPAADIEATAHALAGVLGDEPSARRLGDAAREEARSRFSVDRMVAETLALYDEIARETR